MLLFIYNPTPTIREKAKEFGPLHCDWGDEAVYEIPDIRRSDELNDWLYETNHTEDTILAVKPLDSVDEQLFFDDVYPDSELAPIAKRMSPGGDIRKYTNSSYGPRDGRDGAAECWVEGTCKLPRLASFEPLPMWAVHKSLELGLCEEGMADNPYYPSAERILRWSDVVRDEWGCRTAAIGTMHFDRGQSVGMDGFIIYEADEAIRDWAAERWTDNPPEPYMRPDEFDLRDCSETPLEADSYLRIWFD